MNVVDINEKRDIKFIDLDKISSSARVKILRIFDFQGESMPKDSKSLYYDAGGIELLDVMKAKLTHEQYKGYLLGNVIKYAGRMNWKGTPERDAEKLAIYSRELAELESDKGGSA